MATRKRAKTEGGSALRAEHKVLAKVNKAAGPRRGAHGAHTKESARKLKHTAFQKKVNGTPTRKMANVSRWYCTRNGCKMSFPTEAARHKHQMAKHGGSYIPPSMRKKS